MAKTIFDYMTEDDYNRYNELIDMANDAKAKAPKAPRAPQTNEQKIAAQQKRIAAAQAKLDALLAAQAD